MSEIEQRFQAFIDERIARSPDNKRIFQQSLDALTSGVGSLQLAFELNIIARRLLARSPSQTLLLEVAEALREAAFMTPQGAKYLPSSRNE